MLALILLLALGGSTVLDRTPSGRPAGVLADPTTTVLLPEATASGPAIALPASSAVRGAAMALTDGRIALLDLTEPRVVRAVIGELKKQQFTGDAILPHYEARIRELEKLIVEHKIVTLPDRPMQIRLASEAESAQQPAPNMRPPRMIGKTGEKGTFVLPLRKPGSGSYDDFTFEAGSWTLTAHEGRPGHELQFSSIVEKGVSILRAVQEDVIAQGGHGAVRAGGDEVHRELNGIAFGSESAVARVRFR